MQTVDTNELGWEKRAEDLAKARTSFVILNFSYGRHFITYEMLRENYRFKGSIDREAKKASLEPEE